MTEQQEPQTTVAGVRVPEWLVQGFATVAFGAILPFAVWLQNVDGRQNLLQQAQAAQGEQIEALEDMGSHINGIDRELSVIRTELSYIKQGQSDLKKLLEEQRERERERERR